MPTYHVRRVDLLKIKVDECVQIVTTEGRHVYIKKEKRRFVVFELQVIGGIKKIIGTIPTSNFVSGSVLQVGGVFRIPHLDSAGIVRERRPTTNDTSYEAVSYIPPKTGSVCYEIQHIRLISPN